MPFYGSPDDAAQAIAMIPGLGDDQRQQIQDQLEKEMRANGGGLPSSFSDPTLNFGSGSPQADAGAGRGFVNPPLIGGGSGVTDSSDPKEKAKYTQEVMSDPVVQSLGAMTQKLVASQQAQDATKSAIGVIQSATQDEIKSVNDYADASIVVASAKSGFQAKVDQANAAAVSAFNLDPSQAGYIIAQRASEASQAYTEATELRKQITAKQSISFFENPLAYITAQFTLPSDIAKYNGVAQQYHDATDSVKEAASVVTAVGQANEVTKQGTSLALLDATNKQILSKAQADRDKILIDGTRLGLDGYKTLAQLTDSDLSASNQAIQTDLSLKHYELYRMNAEAMNVQRQLMVEGLRDKIDQRQLTMDDYQNTVRWYNAGASKFGAPTQTDPKLILTWLKQGKPEAVNFYKWGQDSEITGRNTGIPLGISPGDAAMTLFRSRANPVVSDANSPARLLADQLELANKNPAFVATKDPKAQQAILDDTISHAATREMQGISPDKPNAYQAPAIQTVVSAMPNALQNRFIRENIIPLGTEGQANQPANPEMILGAAKAVLQSDPTRFNEVKDGIAQFFRAAVTVNNQTKDYRGLGLPDQMQYNAQLKFGSLWGTGTHDLTNETEIMRLLMITQSGNPGTNLVNKLMQPALQ